MSDFFQLPVDEDNDDNQNPFKKYELDANPFPEAGLGSGVLYHGHMTSELHDVNRWINKVKEATENKTKPSGPVPSLAVYGSIGVGKTHLLSTLDRGLEEKGGKTPVLRKGLADEGMTRLILANLFLRYLPFGDLDEDPNPSIGLLRKLIQWVRDDANQQDDLLKVLDKGSPIKNPFEAILQPDIDDDAIVWLSRWLRREYTTPAQLAKLNLSGKLESEGQAVRVVADLLRLARAAGFIQVWFVMIDQIEELWREGVITPSRRARFLTDLRLLVDQALEGAPIAVLLAWTPVGDMTRLGTRDVGKLIERDYAALWQRLGNPIDLPALSAEHVWPFADEYLKKADVTENNEKRKELHQKLYIARKKVIKNLQDDTPSLKFFPPREVLRAWRTMAESIVNTQTIAEK